LVVVTSALQANAGVDLGPLVLQVVAVFAIAQQIDGFVVQPLVLGSSVKAHPLEVFLVVLMAGMVGGIGGMIAAIPVYTIIRVIAREFFSAFKPIQSLTRDL
jgi:predicted PurR-regulated permease PerM